MSNDLKNIIEAVLLASDSPVTVARLQSLFDEDATPEATQIKEAIELLKNDSEDRGVELRKIGSGYRFQTREKYADYLRKLHQAKPPKLSRALLETLAIVAYRQPVSRGDIEEVRGVAVSSEIMQRLIDREWVKQVGVRDVPGRPALFGTTPEFLSYFSLESLKDLPSLMEQRELGEIAGEMETPLPPEVLAALESSEEEGGSAADAANEPSEDVGENDSEENAVAEAKAEQQEDPGASEEDSVGNAEDSAVSETHELDQADLKAADADFEEPESEEEIDEVEETAATFADDAAESGEVLSLVGKASETDQVA